MKKILLLPILAALMLSCSSDDDSPITTENDACLECETIDFDFSICDFETFAEITITDDDNTTDVKEITYGSDLNYEVLTALSCEKLNDLYNTTSTPTDSCLTCESMDIVLDICENEDGESFTVTYDDKSASLDYEDGETFSDLDCSSLLARALEILGGTN